LLDIPSGAAVIIVSEGLEYHGVDFHDVLGQKSAEERNNKTVGDMIQIKSSKFGDVLA